MTRRIRKVIFLMGAVCTMLCANSFLSYAGEWRTGAGPNEGRWWYAYEDGSYARNGWFWLDGNRDGIEECYYFDDKGWMLSDMVTPDGYTVNADGAWVQNQSVQSRAGSLGNAAGRETAMKIQMKANGHTIVFELNDSPAAESLYSQLPMTVQVENYSDNEKIFYPPNALEIGDTPLTAGGGEGGLAYFSPWGDVIMYYGDFGSYGGLYDLGRTVTGSEWIQDLSGGILIEAADS